MAYQCKICNLEYKKKETAKACQAWCSNHASCNFLIARQAFNKEEMANKPPEQDKRYQQN